MNTACTAKAVRKDMMAIKMISYLERPTLTKARSLIASILLFLHYEVKK